MDDDYDPGHEAEAAMKMTVTAVGPERQRWIGLGMGLAGARPHSLAAGALR